MGIVLQYRFLHHPVRKNYTTEITWPCRHCLCSIRPVCGAFSFSQAPLFQDFGSLRPPSFCQYSIPRRSAAVMESRFRFYRCALQGSSRRRNLSALIGSRLCGLRWLKIFLSLFPPWYFLFVWLQSYLHQLLSNGYVILPSTFHGKKVDRVQPKFLFLHFPKEKILWTTTKKIYPLTFHGKNQCGWAPEKQRIYRMFKFVRGGLLAKRKQAKDCDILCLLRYIFSKQKQDRAIPFPIIFLLRF